MNSLWFRVPVADLGEGPGGGGVWHPLFWVKKDEITEGRKASRASRSNATPHLAQGLDPSLSTDVC